MGTPSFLPLLPYQEGSCCVQESRHFYFHLHESKRFGCLVVIYKYRNAIKESKILFYVKHGDRTTVS